MAKNRQVTYRIEVTLVRGKEAPHPTDVQAALEYARRNDIEGAEDWSAARVRSFAVIDTTNAGTRYYLDDREHATVLAALRYWQREGWRSCGHEIEDIATNGGTLEALVAAEIDGLCERLNCGT